MVWAMTSPNVAQVENGRWVKPNLAPLEDIVVKKKKLMPIQYLMYLVCVHLPKSKLVMCRRTKQVVIWTMTGMDDE